MALALALARLALRNLSQRVSSSSSTASSFVGHGPNPRVISSSRTTTDGVLKRFLSTTAGDHPVPVETSDGKQVAETDKKSKNMFGRKKDQRGLWRRRGDDFVPPLAEFFPSGLGNALLQATENINRLFENINLSPSSLVGRFKEKDDHYKLRYEVPGLGKEDLKITIEDGILRISGEHKEEEEGGESDDEHFAMRSYGYYDTSLMLPDDAELDGIKAELKDGVLHVTIPRTEKPKKEVKEVNIH